MKTSFVSLLASLAISASAMADDVPGLTVEYVANGTEAYVQALSAIGRITFTDGNATIIFKDASAGSEDLGAISAISRISFGLVSESDIKNDDDIETPVSSNKVVVSAYPNPTADHVHVDGLQEGQSVRLFTSDGRLAVVSQQADINLSGMASGVYFLQVGKDVIKIIKK